MAVGKILVGGAAGPIRRQLEDELRDAEAEVMTVSSVAEAQQFLAEEADVRAVVAVCDDDRWPLAAAAELAACPAIAEGGTGLLVCGPAAPLNDVLDLLRQGVDDFFPLPLNVSLFQARLAWVFQKYQQHVEQRAIIESLQRNNSELQQTLAQLYSLHEIEKGIVATMTSDRLAEAMVQKAMSLVGAEMGLLAMVEQGEVVGKAGQGLKVYEVLEFRQPLEVGPWSRVRFEGQVLTFSGAAQLKDLGDWAERFPHLEHALLLPLVAAERNVGMLLLFRSREAEPFRPPDWELLRLYTRQAAYVLENARLHEQLKVQLITDSLTGLYNHRYFQESLRAEIGRSQRYHHPLSLTLVDIDWFKQYNEANGHQAGDLVLITLGRLLRSMVREIDVLARFGVEEFAILMPETNGVGAQKAGERILQRIRSHVFPYETSQPLGTLTCSLGICCFPDGATDQGDLVAGALEALDQAKRSGRDRLHLLVRPGHRRGEE